MTPFRYLSTQMGGVRSGYVSAPEDRRQRPASVEEVRGPNYEAYRGGRDHRREVEPGEAFAFRETHRAAQYQDRVPNQQACNEHEQKSHAVDAPGHTRCSGEETTR